VRGQVEQPGHDRDRGKLADLDPDVEGDHAPQLADLGDSEVLEAGGKAEAVDESESEDDGTEPAEVFWPAEHPDTGDEDDAEGDDDVDGFGADSPAGQGRGDQGGRVSEHEQADQLRGQSGLGGNQEDAGDEEQVVPTEQHVGDADRDEIEHGLVRGFVADAVRVRRGGAREDRGNGEEWDGAGQQGSSGRQGTLQWDRRGAVER
jgi:hypothetical protein